RYARWLDDWAGICQDKKGCGMITSAMNETPELTTRTPASAHPLQRYLERLFARHRDCREGTVADYIPELGKADPGWFGISIATIDGQVYEVGDTRREFTIQSISKPFVYAMALQDNGLASVLDKVGVEPSGDAFNSISLHTGSGRPYNPMINAGAIAASGLIHGADQQDKMDRILETFSAFAGRRLSVDETVYRSERDTGFRNFAIGYMLRNFDILRSDPVPTLDLYFRQCSILVNCRDLAVMAATLANAGVSPITGKVALDAACVPQVLSVMATCGMYDYAGEWIYRVGLPSKSGVAGGIIGVLPGQMGISVFSPPLDPRGNSIRGIRVFTDISRELDLHLFKVSRAVKSVVRTRYTASQVSSKRLRREADTRFLNDAGRRVVVYDLQGDLSIFSIEMVIRDMLELGAEATYRILDFRRVLGAEAPAIDLLTSFLRQCRDQGYTSVLTGLEAQPEIAAQLAGSAGEGCAADWMTARDVDAALEICEDLLLEESMPSEGTSQRVELEDFDICRGFDSERIATLKGMLQFRRFEAGQSIIRRSEPADSFYFLISGQVSVTIDLPDGGQRRLATCTPGMLFGEMAVLERRPRSANVRADGPVECYEMTIADFDQLTTSQPELKVRLLQNFARALSMRVRKLTDEVRVLS
ncbi:MAG: glutaminase A, partial [Planctomycetes bacterium]|nr:glutaminase A [Planctomycetota bacterium]